MIMKISYLPGYMGCLTFVDPESNTDHIHTYIPKYKTCIKICCMNFSSFSRYWMKLTSFVMCALFTSKEKIIRLTPALFGQQASSVSEILPEIASKRFVIFGEEHGKLPIINFQSQIIKQMLAQARISQVLEGTARNCSKYST